MPKNKIGTGFFAAYIFTIVIAFFFGNDRVIILCAAIMSGFGFVFRILYVEESGQIIKFFDQRINETITALENSIDRVHKRIDKHHPPKYENENEND
jgi:hypothetical protein